MISTTIAKAPPSKRRIILAGIAGNVMEWYDFAVYGFLAATIGPKFFPADQPSISVVAAFGAFAVGFLARPLGGLAFGRIGDLIGRRRALTISVLAMAVPTVLLGLLPTYETIGVAAPIAVVLVRLVQGLSVGGECSSTMVFLAENAPPGRRGITAIWGVWGGTAGTLLGSGVAALVAQALSPMQLEAFGWRLPFLLGGLVAVAGYVIRSGLHADIPAGTSRQPVRDTFVRYRWAVAKVALLNVAFAVSFYAIFVYAVTYIRELDRLPAAQALDLNTGSMALALAVLPLAAWLSDRVGRRPLLILGSAILTFGSVPLFHLMHDTDPRTIFLGEAGFVLGFGLMTGALIAANVELIPGAVRCTGLAVSFNLATALFGGTTPLIAAWLIAATGDPVSPAYWVAAGSALSLFAALFLIRETHRERLEV